MTGQEVVISTGTQVSTSLLDSFGILKSNNLISNILGGLFLFSILWSVLWAFKDISTRSRNIFFQLLCGLVAGIPIIGLPLYFLLRPARQLDDKDWRETTTFDYTLCPGCGTINSRDHNYCINCGNMLRTECKECKENYGLDFGYCPNCGAPNLALEELRRKK